MAVGGRLVGVGVGCCGLGVAVGPAVPDVGVGLAGGETGPSPVGMSSSVPMWIMLLVRPFRSLIAWTVVPKRLAMWLSVSPACTTWVLYGGVGLATGVGVSVGTGSGVSVGVAVSVGVEVAVCVAVAVKVGTRVLVGVGVGLRAPVIRDPREQPSDPSTRAARTMNTKAVLRLMI